MGCHTGPVLATALDGGAQRLYTAGLDAAVKARAAAAAAAAAASLPLFNHHLPPPPAARNAPSAAPTDPAQTRSCPPARGRCGTWSSLRWWGSYRATTAP